MCNYLSAIAVRDGIFFGVTDAHEKIIEQHRLYADGARGTNIVRVELSPPDNKPDAPVAEWLFVVDQDLLPEWWDRRKYEQMTRAAADASGIPTLYAEYERQRAPLDAEYQRQRAPLYAEYERQCDSLYAEYKRQRAPLYAEYERQRAAASAIMYAGEVSP